MGGDVRLNFHWWGGFFRGWAQWGRGPTICADKDYSVETLWTYHIGPLQIEWWNRPDWRSFCFTPEEARVADQDYI